MSVAAFIGKTAVRIRATPFVSTFRQLFRLTHPSPPVVKLSSEGVGCCPLPPSFRFFFSFAPCNYNLPCGFLSVFRGFSLPRSPVSPLHPWRWFPSSFSGPFVNPFSWAFYTGTTCFPPCIPFLLMAPGLMSSPGSGGGNVLLLVEVLSCF